MTMQKEGTQERSEATSSWDYTQGWVTFGQHCPCAQPDTEKMVWLTSNGSNAHLKQIWGVLQSLNICYRISWPLGANSWASGTVQVTQDVQP